VNRAARRHLLARLDRANTPLFVVTAGVGGSLTYQRVRAALEKLSWSGALMVLPADCKLKIIGPRSAGVRVVAGKGGRRRGVRRRRVP